MVACYSTPEIQKLKTLLKTRSYWASNGCCLWTGAKYSNGYGRFKWRGKYKSAHRTSYEIAKGPIPAGMLVCHTCDTPACIAPHHLYAGTHQDNMNDMVVRNRQFRPVGAKNTRARLTPDIIKEIRNTANSVRAAARIFGVSVSTVSYIRNGKRWQHI